MYTLYIVAHDERTIFYFKELFFFLIVGNIWICELDL
jgi:hypothetical protein